MENYSNNFKKVVSDLKDTFIRCLNTSDRIFVIPHNNMDFDALASSIAICDICDYFGIDCYIVTNDKINNMNPSFKEVYLELLDKYNFINTNYFKNMKTKNSTLVITDTLSKNLIPITDIDSFDNNIIIIDHHELDDRLISSNNLFISSDAFCASEIVLCLMRKLRINISKDTAQLLLAGFYLDTNKLSSINNHNGFERVANLIKCGANVKEVKKLFTISDFEDDIKQRKILLDLLGYTKFYADDNSRSYAITMNTNDVVYTNEQLAEVCDQLLKYSIDAAFVIGYLDLKILGEGHTDRISIKARSSSGDIVDVSEIMQIFDGGGDKNRAAVSMNYNNIILIKNCLKNIIISNDNPESKKEYVKKIL